LLVFVVTAWLAHEAAETTRSARARAEDTLASYAAFAAERGAEGTRMTTFETLKRVFMPVTSAIDYGWSPERSFTRLDYERHCGCAGAGVRAQFWIDLETGESAVHGEAIDTAVLRTAVSVPVLRYHPEWGIGTSLIHDGERIVAFTSKVASSGEPLLAFGMVADSSFVAPYIDIMAADYRLLPHPQLAEQANFEFLRLSVRGGSRTFYARGVDVPNAYIATSRLDEPFQPLELIVALDPAAANVLLIGGMPPARQPLPLVLLMLSGILLSFALLLLRRETELTRLRSAFVASVSHELRTPLAQIRMFAETLMLGRTRSDAERRKALEIINQEARRLGHLVENVLLFAKGEHSRSAIAREPTPLGTEIEAAIDSFAPFCRSRDVRIRRELEAGVIAPVDRFALRQILINLLDNALKYGSDGQEITVGMAIFDDVVRIWVDDDGPGIPTDTRVRIFEPFYRGERTAERAIAGSGIGLAVVRELAELHGGRTWAEDAPGGGTRLLVEFPGAMVVAPPPPSPVGAVA
jgi:signal transduction histidine kinase